MKNMLFAAAGAALVLVSPASAQNAQERLDARYDRSLAAGYKALFLCSAIANAERNGTTRTPESIHEWELTGIQSPLDEIVRDLPYEIFRTAAGNSLEVNRVAVTWSADMPPRLSVHDPHQGCSVMPVGWQPPPITTLRERRSDPQPIIVQDTSDELAQAVASAFTDEGPRTTAALVLKDGEMVAERYTAGFDPSTPQRTWSVAKSIAATLVGAAVQRGEADVNRSAGLGINPQDALRRSITIDQLLRMASGRYSDTPGNRTDPLYWGGATVAEVALDWPIIAAPGTTYRYANNDTLAAIAAIEGTFADHPPAAFFRQTGMSDTVAETDWQGNYILSSQVWTTARDLGRFGQLYLDDGKLPDGTRILPEGWVQYVSAPSGPQPDGAFGYGAGFWLMNASEGVPGDAFAAFGNRGQYVVIVPSRDVVIVRRGEDPVGQRFDIAAFTRDVLAALE